MALEEEVVLDISGALNAIDDIASALQSAVVPFSDDLSSAIANAGSAPLELETDTEKVTNDIDTAVSSADTQLQFEIDGTPITDEISSAVSSADTQVEVQTDPASLTDLTAAIQDLISALGDTSSALADTTSGITELTTNLDQVKQTSAGASEGMNALSGATKSTEVAAGLAGGEIGSLAKGASLLGPEAGAAAAGLTAVVGVSTELFHKALDLNEAEFRFNNLLGDQAKAVDNIDVGGLSTDIKKLAVEVGGSQANLKNAAANVFQLGTANGTAAPKVAATTKEMIALAARAVAMKPSLGDVGTVTDSMGRALARGGRFAAQFGISLTSAQINAEALKESGKTSASELTQYEKAAAGAKLATDQLGDSLGGDINKYAESDAVKIKSFKAGLEEAQAEAGKPLIPVFSETMKNLVPVIVAVSKDFAELAQVLIPLANVGFPVITAAADELGTTLKAPIEGFKLLGEALDLLPSSLRNGAFSSENLKNTFVESVIPLKGLTDGISGLIGAHHKHADAADADATVTSGLTHIISDFSTAVEGSTTAVATGDATVDGLNSTMAISATNFDTASTAINNWLTTLEKGNDSSLTAIEAENKVSLGQADLATKLKISGGAIQSNTQKTVEGKKAASDSADALVTQIANIKAATVAENTNAEGKVNNKKATQDFIDKLTVMASTLTGPAQQAVQQQIDVAQRYIDKVNEIPIERSTKINAEKAQAQKNLDDVKSSISWLDGKTASVKVNADTSEMKAKLQKTASVLSSNPLTASIGAALGSVVKGLAVGGPAEKGKPYLIGELGPELFIPSVSGTVVPNNKIGKLGGDFVINQENNYGDITREALPELQRLMDDNNQKLLIALQSNRSKF